MKRFIIVLLILITGAAGYLLYRKWAGEELVSWDLVPSHAVLVYQPDNPVESWNHFLNTNIWKNLSTNETYRNINSDLLRLDSISGNKGDLDRILRGSDILISLHVTSKSEYDHLYILPLSNIENKESVVRIAEAYRDDPDFSTSSRIYRGVQITEIKGIAGGAFSYFFHRDFFVGSHTPILVEDVIRILKDDEAGFRQTNSRLFDIPVFPEEYGSVYVSFDRLNQLLGVFVGQKGDRIIELSRDLVRSSVLDVSVDDQQMVFTGFSIQSSEKANYLNTLTGQNPNPFDLKSIIPNRTSVLFHLTFDDPDRWSRALMQFRKSRGFKETQISEFEARYDFSSSRFYSWLGGEVAVATLESVDLANPDKVLFLRSSDISESLNQFNVLTDNANRLGGDTLYVESFGEYRIKHLMVSDFPELLFGKEFNGFNTAYFTVIDNYLVIGNRIESLKSLINAIEIEDTWGKSLEFNQFLENTLSESNYNLFFNIPKSWETLENMLSPDFVAKATNNRLMLRRFRNVAIQFSNVDERFYTSFIIDQSSVTDDDIVVSNFVNENRTFIDTTIASKPIVVRSHLDRSLEVLVQDDLNNIHLIDKTGSVLWSDSIGSEIVGDVYQVDFFRNGKLQYLFAAGSHLHLIDRNGNNVSGYPLDLTPTDIRTFSVIDYDNSKRYRLLVSDRIGNIYMFDKNGRMLEGWSPNALENPLASKIVHRRVRGRDFLIAIEENGNLHVFNRRGQHQKGFPLETNTEIHNPVFIRSGSDFATTILSTINDNGEILQFNLVGSVVNREQLYKPSKDTRFYLVEDALGKGYVIARQDLNRLTMLNRFGNVMFEKDYPGTQQLEVQYYNFGSDTEIFAVTDTEQQFTYIYDQTGKLINEQPLKSGYPIAMIYFQSLGKFHVYRTFDNEFSIDGFFR